MGKKNVGASRGKAKLTDAACRNARSKEKPYKRPDGEGLHLLIHPNGSKYWRLKYRYRGREKNLALGVFPAVSLAEAREKKDTARKQLKAGIDPSEVRRDERKSRPKPAQKKNSFNLSLAEGALTIETATRIVYLTAAQTKALHTFLEAACQSTEGAGA